MPAALSIVLPRSPEMGDLLAISDARALVLEAVRPLPVESVALNGALGRVLAREVSSPIAVPPFDSSAMDGFAVIAGEPAELDVVGEAGAGHPADAPVAPVRRSRSRPGRPCRRGATAVVPVERTEQTDGSVRVPETSEGANIRRPGEDVRPAMSCSTPAIGSAPPSWEWRRPSVWRSWTARGVRESPCW